MSEQKTLPLKPDELLETLEKQGIDFRLHRHEPIFTVAEGEHLKESIPGTHCRNLFVRDKKQNMFLVVAANETRIDMKKLQKVLDCGRLSFGSADRLWENLGITPGSVCPFCIANDTDKNVRIILDHDMMQSEIVNYHPMDNAMTIGITPADLIRYIRETGHEPEVVDLKPAAPDDD